MCEVRVVDCLLYMEGSWLILSQVHRIGEWFMPTEKRYVLDTNVILSDNIYEIVNRYNVAIPSMVIRELENFETNPDKYGQLAWNAREKRRRLKEMDKIYFDIKDYEWKQDDGLSKTYADNNILQYCLDTGSGLISYDGLLAEKAVEYGVEVIDIGSIFFNEEDYTGYVEVYMLPEEHQEFYTNDLATNKYDLHINQYLIILDDISGEVVDALKWDGTYHEKVKSRTIKSLKMGKLAPKDLYQACAIDSMSNNQMTLINGKAGSGKTLLALSYLMQQIEKGKLSKLVVFANSLPTKGAAQLGMYKGSLQDKILQVSVGHILASKFGDYNEVQAMMTTGELLVLPMSDVRGFDATGMNAGILITEGQNMDISLMRLAAERVAKDSVFIVEGDFSQQLDDKSFEGSNNGMRRLSEVFRGQEYFGQVETKNVYRSRIADKAQEM